MALRPSTRSPARKKKVKLFCDLFRGRNDRGSFFIFRFNQKSRDQFAAMVCDNLARSTRHPYLHTDNQQLCENIARSGHRPLAIEFATGLVPRRGNRIHAVETANGRQWTRITAVKRAADMERHQAHRPNLAVGHDVGSAAPTTRTLPIPNNSRKTGGET